MSSGLKISGGFEAAGPSVGFAVASLVGLRIAHCSALRLAEIREILKGDMGALQRRATLWNCACWTYLLSSFQVNNRPFSEARPLPVAPTGVEPTRLVKKAASLALAFSRRVPRSGAATIR